MISRYWPFDFSDIETLIEKNAGNDAETMEAAMRMYNHWWWGGKRL